MNIYFSGIGGVGIGPLAEIAHDAGYHVQGSDPIENATTKRLADKGIAINTKQKGMFLQTCHNIQPIDWFVYSSAIPADHPELVMAKMLGIKTTKRDEFLVTLLEDLNLKLIAVAGTHGKTSTTALLAWTLQQLDIPISYSIGSTLSFGPSGKYDPDSTYFVYECDEYDRNFLRFHPYLSLITAIDYDHPDTYSSPTEYMGAFTQFISQSDNTIIWRHDANLVAPEHSLIVPDEDVTQYKLTGEHNRRNATLVAKALEQLGIEGDSTAAIESFPGADRRFERLAPNIYSDYGHHPTEITATLQLASELNKHVILVYQPHQNIRQHEIRSQYVDCFEQADTVYWLPTYLTREDDNLPILSPDDLTENITNIDDIYIADTDDELWETIQRARDDGKLIIFMGAGSIDEWARERLATPHIANILLVDKEGNFVLQKHDDDDTTHAGRVTTFGGPVIPSDDSVLVAATRLLHEQTNLEFDPTNLGFFKMYLRSDDAIDGEHDYIFFYTLTNIEPYSNNAVSVSPNHLSEHPMTILTRTVITEYTRPLL